MKAMQDFGGFLDEATLGLCGAAIMDIDIGEDLLWDRKCGGEA